MPLLLDGRQLLPAGCNFPAEMTGLSITVKPTKACSPRHRTVKNGRNFAWLTPNTLERLRFTT